MANQEHLDILRRGVRVWNTWRMQHPDIIPDLSYWNGHLNWNGVLTRTLDFTEALYPEVYPGEEYYYGVQVYTEEEHYYSAEAYSGEEHYYGAEADLVGVDANLKGPEFSNTNNFPEVNLSGANLSNTNLEEANLRGANLSNANLSSANLSNANLSNANLIVANLQGANLEEANLPGANLQGAHLLGANLREANFLGADLRRADLRKTDLRRADLNGANLNGAGLRWADLTEASLINTDLSSTDLIGCHIFGISAWGVNVKGAIQKNLIITAIGEPEITVDNLKVAQFIHLLLHNEEIREVIDTIAKKVVLVLGRFTHERKPTLEALRDEIRKYDFSPIVFDFEKPSSRNLTETISTLAHLSCFVIADLTDAKSLPQELERIIPHLPSVPVQPILSDKAREYAMFESYRAYPWVLPIHRYQDIPNLLASIKEHIIMPIEQKEYEKIKTRALEDENRKLREEVEKLRRGLH